MGTINYSPTLARHWWNKLSEEEKKDVISKSEFDLVVVNKLVWATGFEIEEMYVANKISL